MRVYPHSTYTIQRRQTGSQIPNSVFLAFKCSCDAAIRRTYWVIVCFYVAQKLPVYCVEIVLFRVEIVFPLAFFCARIWYSNDKCMFVSVCVCEWVDVLVYSSCCCCLLLFSRCYSLRMLFLGCVI